jgi:diguanylate cyclase (GGDEF)-like protein
VLTGLINRDLFMEYAMTALAAAEEEALELVFAIVDIDYFKRINDTYGQATGDAALAHVAAIFKASIGPDDLLCRFGGEEFAFLINAQHSATNPVLERLRLQLEMAGLDYAGHHLRITASFGAVSTSDCGYNIDLLYNTADKALYSAKQSGRNRIVWSEGLSLTRLGGF